MHKRTISACAVVAAAALGATIANGAPVYQLAERAGLSDMSNVVEQQVDMNKRIVINPHITYPDTTAVWETGQKGVNVTWDVPENAQGYKGRLLLGYLIKGDTTGNEHLYPTPLAEDFNLTDGKVTFDIPCDNAIKSRSTYIVVLMGDSGNKSQNFTIHRVPKNCPNFKSGKKNKTTSVKDAGTGDGSPSETDKESATTSSSATHTEPSAEDDSYF